MIQIGESLVSTELIESHFVCDLSKCKGACCVEGDSGAPLEEAELKEIESAFPLIRDRLPAEALASIESIGLHTSDSDGDLVTPLVNGNRECVYTVFENGVAACAFEKAHAEGIIPFRKPISCHLYPVRIEKMKHYEAVNVHRWSVCAPACSLGEKLKVPMYVFLKEALVRKYGTEWYDELAEVADHYRKANP
ncbi:MAG: hypothetical protein RLZZ630_853 [Bacteroidota bacterium]|jgi:hypothetical protein